MFYPDDRFNTYNYNCNNAPGNCYGMYYCKLTGFDSNTAMQLHNGWTVTGR